MKEKLGEVIAPLLSLVLRLCLLCGVKVNEASEYSRRIDTLIGQTCITDYNDINL